MKILCSNLFKVAGIDEVKDMRGRSSRYRTDATPMSVLDRKFDDGVSGVSDEDKSQELNDVWLDALKRQKDKERKQEPILSFVVATKKK
jgi:sulfite reductase beta subunit-like hemoprotein